MLGMVFLTSNSCRRLAGRINLLFRCFCAIFSLAAWTSRSVSPRAQRVARKRSPGLDRRFGLVFNVPLPSPQVRMSAAIRSPCPLAAVLRPSTQTTIEQVPCGFLPVDLAFADTQLSHREWRLGLAPSTAGRQSKWCAFPRTRPQFLLSPWRRVP